MPVLGPDADARQAWGDQPHLKAIQATSPPTAGAWIAWWAILVLVIAGGAVRAWIWWVHDEVSADEALPGLMAWHIAQGREYPAFYYGQFYFGAAESYLIALLYRLFGFRPWLAVVPSWAASTLLIPAGYVLGRRLGGPLAGVLAAIPMAISPPVLSGLFVNTGGGFSLAFLLQSAGLWCWLRAMDARASIWPLAAGSLIFGVLCWIWQPALALFALLLPIWCWLTARRSWWRLALRFPAAVVPFLAGIAPALIFNLWHDWLTYEQLVGKYLTPAGEAVGQPGAGVALLPALLLAALGGGNEVEGGANAVQAALGAAALPLLLAGLWTSRRRDRVPAGTRQAWRDGWILAIAFAVDVLAAHNTTRHLTPAALLALAAAGPALVLAGRALFPRLALLAGLVPIVAVVGAVVLPNVWLLRQHERIFRHFVAGRRDVVAAVQALDARGLALGYADYWSAYPVTFLSGERMIVAPSVASLWGDRVDRYPAYTDLADAETRIERLFLLLDDRCKLLPYTLVLEQYDATYQLEHVARWYLLWAIQPDAGQNDATLAAWRIVITNRKYC